MLRIPESRLGAPRESLADLQSIQVRSHHGPALPQRSSLTTNPGRCTLYGMARIAGVSISSTEAKWLIEALRQIGRADDVTAAHAIERAVANLAPVDDLTRAERRAVLGVLVDPPNLGELRAKLARDPR